jgi:hypothetical protein
MTEKEKPDKFWKSRNESSDELETSREFPSGENKKEKVADADYMIKEEKTKKAGKKEKPKNKINLEGEKLRSGLAQLILTVIELLRELMEKQAIRRIEYGSLTEGQIEDLGNTFMALKEELKKLKEYFKLEDEDLNIDLGPIMARPAEDEMQAGKVSAVEILDRLLGKGVVVKGDVVISVAEVDLLSLNLGLLLASIDKARELYSAPETRHLEEEVRKLREENLRLKSLK